MSDWFDVRAVSYVNSRLLKCHCKSPALFAVSDPDDCSRYLCYRCMVGHILGDLLADFDDMDVA